MELSIRVLIHTRILQLTSISDWTHAGAAADKLSLGLPFYGRSWTLEQPYQVDPKLNTSRKATGEGLAGLMSETVGILSYPEICGFLREGWKKGLDTELNATFAFNSNQWVSYDDPAAITNKVKEFVVVCSFKRFQC